MTAEGAAGDQIYVDYERWIPPGEPSFTPVPDSIATPVPPTPILSIITTTRRTVMTISNQQTTETTQEPAQEEEKEVTSQQPVATQEAPVNSGTMEKVTSSVKRPPSSNSSSSEESGLFRGNLDIETVSQSNSTKSVIPLVPRASASTAKPLPGTVILT